MYCHPHSVLLSFLPWAFLTRSVLLLGAHRGTLPTSLGLVLTRGNSITFHPVPPPWTDMNEPLSSLSPLACLSPLIFIHSLSPRGPAWSFPYLLCPGLWWGRREWFFPVTKRSTQAIMLTFCIIITYCIIFGILCASRFVVFSSDRV